MTPRDQHANDRPFTPGERWALVVIPFVAALAIATFVYAVVDVPPPPDSGPYALTFADTLR